MRKASWSRFAILVAFVAVLGPLSVGWFERTATGAADQGVVVASWGGSFQDAQRKVFFAPFERETGIKVIEATEPSLARVRAMVLSRNVEWDVIGISASQALVASKNGLLEDLDYRKVDKKVLDEIDPRVVKPYGIGAYFYATVIGYNTRKYSKEHHPRSWAEFWDVKRFPGPRVVHAGNYSVPAAEYALLADGVPPDKLYPLDLERAYRSLSKIRPYVVKWSTSGAMGPQALVDGEADMAAVSHGRIPQLMRGGAPIDFEWNQGVLQFDFWAIPKGSKNFGNAMKFIEFASRAKPQADLVREQPFGPTNRRAFEYLTEEEARQLSSYPENLKKQILQNYEWWGETDASGKSNVERSNEMWNAWISK